jgi:hypothetical protein
MAGCLQPVQPTACCVHTLLPEQFLGRSHRGGVGKGAVAVVEGWPTAVRTAAIRSCILRNCIDNAADVALTWLDGAPATMADFLQHLLRYTTARSSAPRSG